MTDYVIEKGKKWKIGDATIESIVEVEVSAPFDLNFRSPLPTARMSEAEFKGELAWLIPDFAEENYDVKFGVQSFLIKYREKNILVETGMNIPGIPWEDNLKAAGCTLEDIDYVMFTHLHHDHTARNTQLSMNGTLVPTFPKARYLFGREQYNHFKELYEHPEKRERDPVAHDMIWPYLTQMLPLVEKGLVDFVDDDFNLDNVISVYPTSGHTVGHYAIVIESKGDSAWIAGDMAHLPFQVTQTDVSGVFDVDPVMGVQTRERVFAQLAGTNTFFLGMHWAGARGGFVVKADKGYKLVQKQQK